MANEMGHKARKRFGQNFLHDPHIISRITRSIAAQANDNMVEIGPGQGAITGELLPSLDHLNVIELDRDLIPILQINFASQLSKLTIHEADALKFNFNDLVEDERPLRVVGNLPYNISTPLLFHLFSHNQHIKDMHFMLQLEVVQRLAAKHGSKTYGRLSIMAQYYCEVEHLFDVPRGAFNPPPKVVSAIVRLTPHKTLPYVANDMALFNRLLRGAFSQRRKTLRNTVKQFATAEQMAMLDIDLSLRPEQVDLPSFVHLANQLAQFTENDSTESNNTESNNTESNSTESNDTESTENPEND